MLVKSWNRLVILGIQLPHVHPYQYHFSHKIEIENISVELLEVKVILPSTIPQSSHVFMLKLIATCVRIFALSTS